jgi:hypothetical protein
MSTTSKASNKSNPAASKPNAAASKPKAAASKAAASKSKAAAGAVSSEMSYDMNSLAKKLGKPDKGFAARTFAKVREEALVEDGTRTDSQNVLDDVPRFVGSAISIGAALSAPQRALVRLPGTLLPLLVHEAAQLWTLKQRHEGQATDRAADKAERETKERRAMQAGITERDAVYDALRNALGDERQPELDAIVGRADSSDNLAKGFVALADFIDRVAKASADDAISLKDYGAGPDCAKTLRKRAKTVKDLGKVTAAPGRRVSQRALDLQDGRVLLLIGKVLRAYRAARRSDPTILLPELNRIAWMFESRPKGKTSAPAEKPEAAGAGKGQPG